MPIIQLVFWAIHLTRMIRLRIPNAADSSFYISMKIKLHFYEMIATLKLSNLILIILNFYPIDGIVISIQCIIAINSYLQQQPMETFIAIFLSIASAIFTHVSVRNFEGKKRRIMLYLAIVLLITSFYWGKFLGGFWPGIYTLICIYILVTAITPWISYLHRKKYDR